MMRKYFELKKGSRLLLYGAASSGTLLYEKLQHSDYIVEGFIDQRAEEIKELKGIRVYSLQDAAREFSDSDIGIIISVKNVFEHSKIANELFQQGFRNIIYKPYAVLHNAGTKEENKISQVYDEFLHGNYEYDLSLNCVCKENFMYFSEKYLIEENKGCSVVFLSVLSLFENRNLSASQQERNVMFFFPHIQFFRYLQGELEAGVDYYLQYCEMAAKELNSFAVTDAWRKNVIRNRVQIYEEMNHSYMMDREFFQSGAPDVVWNEKGYFNLVSGKHRAAFFVSKGIPYIPVKMNNRDRDKWLNRENVERVTKLLMRNNIMELCAPIEHPVFYQYPCNARSFFYGLCSALATKISRIFYITPLDNYVENKTVFLSIKDYGLMGRFFRRCGAAVCEKQEEDAEIVEALNHLFYLDNGRKEKEYESYDIAVIKIESEEEKKKWMGRITAKHWFFIVLRPENFEIMGMETIYGGMAWGEQVKVLYLETENV